MRALASYVSAKITDSEMISDSEAMFAVRCIK